MNQVNQLILYVSRTIPFRSGLDRHLIRAAMVFTFFAFSIQKWSQYTAEMLEHVPPELNRQDSHGVLDRRFYRH